MNEIEIDNLEARVTPLLVRMKRQGIQADLDELDRVEARRKTDPHAKAMRATRAAIVSSILAAAFNAVMGYWRPWHYAVAVVLLLSAFMFWRVLRGQRALYGVRK